MTKIKRFLTNVRYWLILRLAGNDTIVINATFVDGSLVCGIEERAFIAKSGITITVPFGDFDPDKHKIWLASLPPEVTL